MKQVILSSTVSSPASSGVHAALIASTSAGWGTEGNSNKLFINRPCVLKNLTIDLRTAPGVGTSRTFEIYKNGSSTGMSVTISGTSTQGSNSTASVSCSVGDYVTIYTTYTGTPAAFTRCSWSVLSENADKIYLINFGSIGAPSTSARNFQYPFTTSGLSWAASDSSAVRVYFSHSATIKEFYAKITTSPGASKQYVFSIYKNGADQASTQITISGSSTSGEVKGLSISVSAGDYISVSSIPTGTPAATGAQNFQIIVEPAVDGESLMSASISSVSATLPTWYRTIFPGQSGSTSTEINSRLIVPVNTSFYVKNFYAITGAPGVGKSRTFTVRRNEANVTNAVTITGAVTTGSDTTHIDKFSALDYISAQAVASGSPTAANSAHYCTMYIPPDPIISTFS